MGTDSDHVEDESASKGRAKQHFGAALSPSLEAVRDSPHRTQESQSGPEVQEGASCPQSCQCPQATISLSALV